MLFQKKRIILKFFKKIIRFTCLFFIYSGNLENKESSKHSSLFSKPGKRISTTLIPIKRKNTDSGSQKDLDVEKESAGGGRRIHTTFIDATSSKDTEKEKELIKDKKENKAEQDIIDENSDLEEETIEGVEEYDQIDQFDVKGKKYYDRFYLHPF